MKTRIVLPLVALVAAASALVSFRALAHSVSSAPRPSAVDEPTPLAERSIEGLSPPLPYPGPKTTPSLTASFRADPLPREPSPKPALADWKGLPEYAVSGSTQCKAQRLREWIRLRCDYTMMQEVGLAAGDAKDVSFAVWSPLNDSFDTHEAVTMAVRSGDRRAITFTDVEFTRYAPALAESLGILTETWIEGEAAPTIEMAESGARAFPDDDEGP